MPEIRPPKFAGMIWTDWGPGRFTAGATEGFWTVYRLSRERLFRLGIRVEKAGDNWNVIFTARFSRSDVQQQIDGMLAEVAEVEARRIEQRREADERWARIEKEKAEERARYAAEHAKLLAERLPPAIEAARKTLAQFGEFTVRKERLRQLIQRFDDPDNVHPLGLNDLATLEDSVHETGLKSQGMFAKIRDLKTLPVDWPDAEVVEAVERLTLQDSDHASVDNSIGWNKPDSPSGHWAYAMLHSDSESNRVAAIKLARAMVGKYAVTQLGREAA